MKHHATEKWNNHKDDTCVQMLPEPQLQQALEEAKKWKQWQAQKDANAKRKADKDADDDDNNDKDEDETEVVKRLCTQTLLHELAERCTR